MLIIKNKPVTYDSNIEKLNALLHDNLQLVWKLRNPQSYVAYGRVYRNATERGYVPEFYSGSGEYKDVLLDDKLSAISFFGISNMGRASTSMERKLDVHFVMIANLEAIKGANNNHRLDAEIQKDVDVLLQLEKYGFIIKSGPITGSERVFEEYPGMAQDSMKYKSDMYPWHCFRYNLELTYTV